MRKEKGAEGGTSGEMAQKVKVTGAKPEKTELNPQGSNIGWKERTSSHKCPLTSPARPPPSLPQAHMHRINDFLMKSGGGGTGTVERWNQRGGRTKGWGGYKGRCKRDNRNRRVRG